MQVSTRANLPFGLSSLAPVPSEPPERWQQLGGDQLDHGERFPLSHARPEEAKRHVRRAQRVEPRDFLETFIGRADHERIIHETLDAIGEASADTGQAVLRVGAVLGFNGGPCPRARPSRVGAT